MKNGKIVLINKKGDVARTFEINQPKVTFVYLNDQRRLEACSNLKDLEASNQAFEKIATVSRTQLQKSPVKLGGWGEIRFVPEVDSFSHDHDIITDEPRSHKSIYKWTAIAHVVPVLLSITISFFFYQSSVDEMNTVYIKPVKQEKKTVTKKVKAPTVSVSKKKIKRSPRRNIKKKVVARATKKTIRRNTKKRVVKRARNSRNTGRSGHGFRQRGRETGGALGVLSRNARRGKGQGLNVNSLNANNAGSGRGKGAAARGGSYRSVYGKGLFAGGSGSSGKIKGSGGYATKGKGGGRAQYGRMRFTGSGGSRAYLKPLEREAEVQGGLDRDQIEAVIQRHRGAILACYEKGLQVRPDLKGRVALRFVIAVNGRVSTAAVKYSSMHSPTVEGCMVRQLKSWKFPKPYGGVNVRVSYPFVFQRTSQG